jgi:hypothetical protein
VVNQERILGYSEAITLLDREKDSDLISFFEENSQQAQQFKSQLVPLARREGEVPDNNPCGPKSEVLYKNWFDAIQSMPQMSREDVLVVVIKGEKDVERIYRIALDNLEVVEENVSNTIHSQVDHHVALLQDLRELLENDNPQ